ncbi:MAG: hypothetical protein IJA22_00670, partial [Clostridia bacterium]|nr:hypothetical protein [Clostridia bacterium]
GALVAGTAVGAWVTTGACVAAGALVITGAWVMTGAWVGAYIHYIIHQKRTKFKQTGKKTCFFLKNVVCYT